MELPRNSLRQRKDHAELFGAAETVRQTGSGCANDMPRPSAGWAYLRLTQTLSIRGSSAVGQVTPKS